MDRLIAAVVAHPVIYATSKRQLQTQEVQQKLVTAWTKIAEMLQYENAKAAEDSWEALLQQYTAFLVHDTPFAYFKEMAFMQKYLVLKAGNDDDIDYSDDDFEYQALERAMEMDDIDDVLNQLTNKVNAAHATPDSTQTALESSVPPNAQNSNQYFAQQTAPLNGANQYQNESVNLVWSPEDLILVDETQLVNRPQQENAQAVADVIDEQWNTAAASNAHQTVTKSCQTTNNSQVANSNQQSMIVQDNSNFKNFSSNELIFLGYAKTVSQMPMPLQLKTKRKIAEVMEAAEMELMNAT